MRSAEGFLPPSVTATNGTDKGSVGDRSSMPTMTNSKLPGPFCQGAPQFGS